MSEAIELPRRRLAENVPTVSPLGLAGSYGIDAKGVERAFHELSINYFFVTTRAKEQVAGVRNLIRAGHRDKLVIAAGAGIPIGMSVPREWEKIARALDTDYIDVFHLFWVQARWYVSGKTWPAMEALRRDGKAKALAISCHDRPMARELADRLKLDALMIRYNAAHRGAEREIFSTLDDGARPGIIAYTATRWGRLLEPLGEHRAMTAPECYRFALMHPKVDVVLTGPRDYQELADNAKGVLAGPLEAARVDEIKKFGDAVRSTVTGRVGFAGA